MPSPTAFALTGLIAWALFLLIWMEALRSWLVLRKQVPANGFQPDNGNLSPFMQRLARAHANCIEGLPLFGGLLLLALATQRTGTRPGSPVRWRSPPMASATRPKPGLSRYGPLWP